ncbi:MAG: hypothetical protein PHP93_06940 [Kiritimatiellales bacterium]|nr:hypothetical protein [Kiritimatiellales bacterium]
MKPFLIILVISLYALTVSAETTLELLQKRAAEGDTTAQTLIGMMYQYGYQVPRDFEKAENYYTQGSQGGDSFADARIQLVRKLQEAARNLLAASTTAQNPTIASAGTAPANDIKSRIAQASGAEYKGKVTLEDLRLKRSDYIGCIVMVRFDGVSLSPSMAKNPFLHVYGDGNRDGGRGRGAFGERILYDEKNSDATKWAVDCARRGSGSFSVYVLVDDRDLTALGERRKKDGNGYSYNW